MLSLEHDPVMQPVRHVLPELHTLRDKAVAAPVGWARHGFAVKALLKLFDALE